MSARRGVLGVLVVLAVLAGCAAPRPVPDARGEAWQRLRPQLARLDQWRAEGRLVVRGGQDGAQGGGQVSFVWIERADGTFQLRLAGPWGQGVARLSGGGAWAELVTGEGRRYFGRDAMRLLVRVYGWRIPIARLRHWMLGLPGPGAEWAAGPTGASGSGSESESKAEFTLDRFGRLATLDWRDWHIEYGRYRLTENGIDLPAVLTAIRDDGEVEIRMAIGEWRLGPLDDSAPVPESPVPLMGSSIGSS